MGSVLELFGHIFAVKNEAAAPKMPQERPKAPNPEIRRAFAQGVSDHEIEQFFELRWNSDIGK